MITTMNNERKYATPTEILMGKSTKTLSDTKEFEF
jgi:hypothetical protein